MNNKLKSFIYFQAAPEEPGIPLASFKSDPMKYYLEKQVDTTFLSSGTTQSERSQAHFSKQGMDAYRLASVKHFETMLGVVTGRNPRDLLGFSFIPPQTGSWQNSSLAKMISWISETLDVQFINDSQWMIPQTPDCPVWVFGTALHFLEYLSAVEQQPLPPGSVVIETGGFKGRHRSTTRADLYRDLCDAFQITPNQIVSEYGMCELAAQAYDFIPNSCSGIVPLSKRWFQFADDVKSYVSIDPDTCGRLVVSDPNRIDMRWPIVTEDLVNMREDGHFQLLGRVSGSAQRGCSLNVEDMTHKHRAMSPGQQRRESLEFAGSGERTLPDKGLRPSLLLQSLGAWLQSDDIVHQWANEFGCLTQARMIARDLIKQLPMTEDAWISLSKIASSKNMEGETWIFLMPSGHSVAAIYPLVTAYLLGIRCIVKPSRRNQEASTSIKQLLKFMDHELHAQVELAEPDASLDQVVGSAEARGIFCFGSDATIKALKKKFSLPICGAGHALSLCVTDLSGLVEHADAIATDIMSLQGRGCMSTRGIIVHTDGSTSLTKVIEATADVNNRLRSKSKDQSRALSGQIYSAASFDAGTLSKILLHSPANAIPVLAVISADSRRLNECLRSLIDSTPQIQWITCNLPDLIPEISKLPVGSCQTTPWTGLHGSSPLFRAL